MKLFNSMLICLYGLVICDWILAAPEPKCMLNKTREEPSEPDPINFNEDPIISGEVKALDRQIELLNSIIVWPFKYFCDEGKNGLKDCDIIWEYLTTLDVVKRSKAWITGEMDS
ncbi:uncharacterized protein LOC119557670 [Drosophila subpulchrella]|uniref:uncharacterized protein LOC119557670 n=1 Tax=Drosophila subpulchrella TaxID=1486046 RepID=UPI0018A19345|nr:uncharacterized protein LOC119557670 [Drosophila subpulchrella]